MGRYTLRDDGFTYKKIMHGREWVGRVIKVADGTHYFARIGKTEATGPNELAAFHEVVAKHLGFDNAAALDRRNSQVRAVNNANRQRARVLADRFMRGDLQEKMNVVDELFGIPPRR